MTRAFRLCVAAIAAHVIDDSFAQPEPGTSAGDHLVSGLAPLAVLAAAAWAYPRLRGGARGALALVLGVFGIVAGVESVHYASTVGASGDDYTGLLSIPAGLALLGIGAATLWRSRRRDGRRFLRRTLLGAAGAVVALLVVAPLSGGYLITHLGRSVVPEANLGVAHEDMSFETADGLTLRGWYVPSRNGAAVIAFPGRSGPQAHARMLARHGYGVLLFDRRGEGASEGDPNAFGWGGERDVKAAIEYLRSRPDVDPDRIGGLGLSVGGELMLQTAAETSALAAVVSEGASGRSVGEDLDTPGSRALSPQAAISAAMTAGVAVFSGQAPPPNLKELVPRIAPRPLFLIHSGIATERLNDLYHRIAGEPKALWEIPGAGHTGGLEARPEEYERRVVGFFDAALLR